MTSVSVTQEEIHLPIPQLVYFSHDLYCTSNTNSLVNIVTERLTKHLLVDILIGVQSQGSDSELMLSLQHKRRGYGFCISFIFLYHIAAGIIHWYFTRCCHHFYLF